jgi:Calcineurin-like phosphoesterase
MARGRGGVAGLVGVALVGCSTAPAPPRPQEVLAAYTLLAPAPGGATVPLARAVVGAGQACPELATGRGPVRMTARANPNPATFPVEVCEATYGLGERASVAGTALPEVAADPRRVVVVGDTGCGSWQDCDDPEAWPFAGLAAAAAKEPPDVVVHVGDYNYRGTPGSIEVNGVKRTVYDAGDNAPEDPFCQLRTPYVSQNAPGSSLPDGWEAWRADFFAPAAPLLAAAPWVMTRGNHELCSRAGPGYLYLLDPHSDLLGGERGCPAQRAGTDPSPSLAFVPPYRVELGALRLVALDSANACDLRPNLQEVYVRQLDQAAGLAEGRPTWLVTHRPVWGVDAASPEGYQVGSNVALQQALRRTKRGAFPPEVELVLSGHDHRFEALSFPGTGRPPQLVIGNSGVGLTDYPLSGAFATEVDGAPAQGLAARAFGYLDARLLPEGGWAGEVVNPLEPEVVARCGSAVPGAGGRVCAPATAAPGT